MEKTHNQQNPEERLRQMLPDIRVIQMLYVAAKLGIADILSQGPMSVEDLAQESKVNPDTLYRLLRALASLGVFKELEPRQFALTDIAQLLRSDVPNSMRNGALWIGEPWRWRPFGELLYSVRTGLPAFPHVFDQTMFEYLANDPEGDEIFNRAMVGVTTSQGTAVAESYDFRKANVIIDVGGGHGALLAAILKKFDHARGILSDLPGVVKSAPNLLAEAGVLERCDIIGASFFEEIPSGGDIYIMKLIIHDWDDEHASRILQKCRAAMRNDAILLLVEWVIPPGNEPHRGKIIDMEMLTLFGSQERTAKEYEVLLEKAGFTLEVIFPTSVGIDIIEARPA